LAINIKEENMKNRKQSIVVGIAAIALTLALPLTLTNCPQPTSSSNSSSGSAETWTDVTSLSQINGTWKGGLIETYPTEWPNVNERFESEGTITFNASAKTASVSMKYTYTFSGSGLSSSWTNIKTEMATVSRSSYSGTITMTATFNDTAHTATYTLTDSGPIGDPSGLKINRDGTKLRLPDGLILYKQ
jgi:hypothetical protein